MTVSKRAAGGSAKMPVARVSPADLMQFAAGAGPAPMNIGAVLVLSADAGFRFERARQVLGERICAVPRMRQRLHRAPPGCGRPFWADDPAFDVWQHIGQVPCAAPGDERALLDVAATVIARPLPRSRPLWSATFVTGLADGGTGLIIVVDHVLADGIGGLAVLARLADESPGPQAGGPEPFPAPVPTARMLAADPWADRAGRLVHLKDGVRTIRQGLAELGGTRPPQRLPQTSLNRPTGPRRRLDVVAADLTTVRALGHTCGGTVNDVILADRVARVAAITGERKRAARGTSAGLLGPLFRLLAATGLLRWVFNHQRLVTTFVTDLRGPAESLSLAGASLRAVLPIPETTGNIPVTFAALSYAGTLWLTVLSDPDQVPDVAVLTAALREDLGPCRHRNPGAEPDNRAP